MNQPFEKRLVPSRLHELRVSKLLFVSRIEFIRFQLSNFSASVSGVRVWADRGPLGDLTADRRSGENPPRPGRPAPGDPHSQNRALGSWGGHLDSAGAAVWVSRAADRRRDSSGGGWAGCVAPDRAITWLVTRPHLIGGVDSGRAPRR